MPQADLQNSGLLTLKIITSERSQQSTKCILTVHWFWQYTIMKEKFLLNMNPAAALWFEGAEADPGASFTANKNDFFFS